MKLVYKVLLFFIVFFLISIIDAGYMMNRAIRLIPNLAAIIILIYSYKLNSNKYILGFLVLLLLSAIASFDYENMLLRRATIIFSFLAYLVLGFSILPKVGKLKTNWFLSVYFIIALLVAIYLFSQLLDISKAAFEGKIEYMLFMLNSIGFIFVIASAMLYIHHSPNKRAMLFLLIVMVFILSEMTRFALYYSDVYIDFFYYSCRFFYVLGLALVIYYCGLNKRQKLSSEISYG